MNVLVPSVPGRYRITDRMLDDFLCDPVLAAKVIHGFDLDVFQAARLRYHWWFPNLIDSSSYSSGKTLVDFIYTTLRPILLPPGHTVGVYYVNFTTGKNAYWDYFQQCSRQSRLFAAHLGRIDEDGAESGSDMTHGTGCWTAYLKPDAKLLMPAPSWAKQASGQASLRLNTILLEEWTHIESQTGEGKVGGIDAQIVGRAAKHSFNKNHPIWATHVHLTAPAKTRAHPAWPRYARYLKAVTEGNPDYATVTWSFKDWSDQPCPHAPGQTWADKYRIQKNIALLRTSLPNDADWAGEGLGIWSLSGAGWYPEEAFEGCREAGRQLGVRPIERAGEDWLGADRKLDESTMRGM